MTFRPWRKKRLPARCRPGYADWRWRVAMPKRAVPIDRPEIQLDAKLSMPLYKQLYGRLRRAILTGQLRRGARLPSTRTLASELGVSRFTIVAAYDLLTLEGYLESHVGHGPWYRASCWRAPCTSPQEALPSPRRR